jgi:hypothetical protein
MALATAIQNGNNQTITATAMNAKVTQEMNERGFRALVFNFFGAFSAAVMLIAGSP